MEHIQLVEERNQQVEGRCIAQGRVARLEGRPLIEQLVVVEVGGLLVSRQGNTQLSLDICQLERIRRICLGRLEGRILFGTRRHSSRYNTSREGFGLFV